MNPNSLANKKISSKGQMFMIDGQIVARYEARVGKYPIKDPLTGATNFATADEALAAAKRFRDLCKEAVSKKGGEDEFLEPAEI